LHSDSDSLAKIVLTCYISSSSSSLCFWEGRGGWVIYQTPTKQQQPKKKLIVNHRKNACKSFGMQLLVSVFVQDTQQQEGVLFFFSCLVENKQQKNNKQLCQPFIVGGRSA
jgi:hypothetical protein